jgi:hypothetical protein
MGGQQTQEPSTPRAKSLANLRPWKPGQSGNPTGINGRVEPRVRRYARKYDRRMCRVLARIAEDPKVPAAERRRAAMDLVAIGSGRPATTQELVGRPELPLIAMQFNGAAPANNGGATGAIDTVAELAMDGPGMPDDRHAALVASVIATSEAAAARVAARRQLPAIEAEPVQAVTPATIAAAPTPASAVEAIASPATPYALGPEDVTPQELPEWLREHREQWQAARARGER